MTSSGANSFHMSVKSLYRLKIIFCLSKQNGNARRIPVGNLISAKEHFGIAKVLNWRSFPTFLLSYSKQGASETERNKTCCYSHICQSSWPFVFRFMANCNQLSPLGIENVVYTKVKKFKRV